jgi:GTP-binding protein YchF
MGFNCGIVGLPNAGKSTIFNALTSAGVEIAPYPFSTIQPHQGISPVPDPRLQKISQLIRPDKTIPTTLEIWDIAGLVKGASKGEGLGNQFLSQIRNVDALVHVVRCFEDENVAQEGEGIDPIRDIDVVNTELILADLDILSRRITKTAKLAKVGDKQARDELDVLKEVEEKLDKGIPARGIEGVGNYRLPEDLTLLTAKPVLYVANLSEGDPARTSDQQEAVARKAAGEHAPSVAIAGKVEAELQELGSDERQEFLKEFGFERSGLEELVLQGYQLLHLITFYTTVSKELKAWTVTEGTKAPAAAGKIHSDMEKGFIKAEVIAYEDFVASGSLHAAREKGMIALEGKEYEVRDGDIITFRFNV